MIYHLRLCPQPFWDLNLLCSRHILNKGMVHTYALREKKPDRHDDDDDGGDDDDDENVIIALPDNKLLVRLVLKEEEEELKCHLNG